MLRPGRFDRRIVVPIPDVKGREGILNVHTKRTPVSSTVDLSILTTLPLDDDSLWAGIIADGHHVHPASIRLAHKAKPAGKLVLVTDAMATVGSDNPGFKLYGEEIRASDGRLVNADGVLAVVPHRPRVTSTAGGAGFPHKPRHSF